MLFQWVYFTKTKNKTRKNRKDMFVIKALTNTVNFVNIPP